MNKFTRDDLRNLKPEDLEISEADLRTVMLAMIQLTVVQAYLRDLLRSVGEAEGPDGAASRAWNHVEKAVEMLRTYPITPEH